MFYLLKDRYHMLSLPLKSSFWFMVCNFTQKCISMVTTPVFTRILSEEEYGICGIYSSWSMVFEIIVSLCLGSCAMVLYTKLDDKERVLSSLTSLQLILGAVWSIVFLIAHTWLAKMLDMSGPLCMAMILSVASSQAIYLWMGYKRYLYEYKGSVLVTIVVTLVSNVASVLSVLFISKSAAGRLLPAAFVNVVAALALYAWDLRECFALFDAHIWKFAFSFGIPLIPHAVSQFVLSVSDRLMINYMCSTRDVAMYSVAGSVGAVISMFTASVNASFSPYQYQQIKNKCYEQLGKKADQVMFILAVILCGIMLFGYEITMIFGGKKYEESAQMIVPLCLGAYFGYLFQLFSRVQEYFLHKATLAIASTLCAVVNIAMNFVFIGLYGYRAAAYTTFVCYMAFCLLHFGFYKRVLRIELDGARIYHARRLAALSGCLIAAGFLIGWVSKVRTVKYFVTAAFIFGCVINRKKLWVLLQDSF